MALELDQSVPGHERNPAMLVATLLVCFVAWLGWYRWSLRNALGPKPWPVFGVLIEATYNWYQIHDWMTKYLYHIHTMRVHAGFGFNCLLTVDPANIEHVMKSNFANYPKVRSFFPSQTFSIFQSKTFTSICIC